ncbi:MAG: putative rane protein [Alphaproteobacteria bacterium]|nr:putative rane protein [Alphaproteobacteria bacterium]
MDMLYWDHYYDKYILLNLAMVIALFASLRLFAGLIGGVKPTVELIKKDNPAFGIALAGVILAIALLLSGTIYGSLDTTLLESAETVIFRGVLGVILLAVTRIIFDRITLSRVHIKDEIIKGNVAVAIADTSNVIAAAIIVRAVFVWGKSNSMQGIVALVAGYAVSQLILTFITMAKLRISTARYGDRGIQRQLKNGNIAVSLRFAGQKIGTAFAIAIAASLIATEDFELLPVLGVWFLASLLAIFLLKLISFISERIILFKVDINDEVIGQGNIAVGAVIGIIYVAIGLLLSSVG